MWQNQSAVLGSTENLLAKLFLLCFFSKSNYVIFPVISVLHTYAWLPDGTFSYQKSQFGDISEGLRMVNVGMFYGPLVQFTAVWCIL
jgi:hypothetical protein